MGNEEIRARRRWLEGVQEWAAREAVTCKEYVANLYGESQDAAHFVEKAAGWLEEAEQEIENTLLGLTGGDDGPEDH